MIGSHGRNREICRPTKSTEGRLVRANRRRLTAEAWETVKVSTFTPRCNRSPRIPTTREVGAMGPLRQGFDWLDKGILSIPQVRIATAALGPIGSEAQVPPKMSKKFHGFRCDTIITTACQRVVSVFSPLPLTQSMHQFIPRA